MPFSQTNNGHLFVLACEFFDPAMEEAEHGVTLIDSLGEDENFSHKMVRAVCSHIARMRSRYSAFFRSLDSRVCLRFNRRFSRF